MAKLNNEIKTGIVVIVAALFLLFMVYKVGGIRVEKGYELNCFFNYVGGLEEKSPVKLAGVQVGEVKKVSHTYVGDETKVLVTLSLKEQAKIRQDSDIDISTTGLIGEKYVEISGGSKGTPFVKPGTTLVGKDPFRMEDLVEMGEELAARLDESMQDLQKLMKDTDGVIVDNREDIRTTIVNLKDSSENFKEFSDDIRRHPWKLLIKGREKKK